MTRSRRLAFAWVRAEIRDIPLGSCLVPSTDFAGPQPKKERSRTQPTLSRILLRECLAFQHGFRSVYHLHGGQIRNTTGQWQRYLAARFVGQPDLAVVPIHAHWQSLDRPR